MPYPIVVTDIIDQVRDQLDESNTTTISDADILQALNRAQDYASSLLVRHYPDPLIKREEISLVGGQASYDMPEDIFEDRLLKVEIIEGGIAWEVKRISYRDVSPYETKTSVVRPNFYYILEKQLYLTPAPSSSGSVTIRYWYVRELDQLVKEQGRITSVNTASNYVIVDSLGDDLTAEADDLNSYVNIVDAQTGEIKCSNQIQNIDTTYNRITFKTSPTRSTVYNRSIVGSIDSDVEEDDLICVSRGNCIPYLKKPLQNHMIQYAVVELKRRLGEPTEAEERALGAFIEQVESQWVGREQSLRVKKRSTKWQQRFRRNFTDYI